MRVAGDNFYVVLGFVVREGAWAGRLWVFGEGVLQKIEARWILEANQKGDAVLTALDRRLDFLCPPLHCLLQRLQHPFREMASELSREFRRQTFQRRPGCLLRRNIGMDDAQRAMRVRRQRRFQFLLECLPQRRENCPFLTLLS